MNKICHYQIEEQNQQLNTSYLEELKQVEFQEKEWVS